MTLFGIDISDFQRGLDLSQVAREGFSWVEAKVSEGNYFRASTWASFCAAAAAAGLPIIGYHYANAACSPASQVQTWQAAGGPNVCMIDFESGSGNIGDYWALVDAFNTAGVQVALTYLPHWYWQQISEPDLSQVPGLVASDYLGGSGYASQIYDNAGGDGGGGWTPYGGGAPAIWQFTDAAQVAGRSVDADAFRGSLDELTARLDPGEDMALTTQQAQQLQEIWDQLRGPDGKGWGQLGTNEAGEKLSLVDGVAGLITTVGVLAAEVQALKGGAS